MMKCVWCGKISKKKFHTEVRWDDLYSKWYRCQECDSLMILPRPSKKMIKKVYENDYLNRKLQPHIGVDCRIRYSKKYRPTVFKEYQLSLIDLEIKKNGINSILDFGCADGIFLEFCKKYFNPKTKLYGADISKNLTDQARRNGWDIIPIADLGKITMKFDLITLWDVIEHVENPDATISSLKRLLKPKGKILIETPRFGILGELRGKNWPHLLPVQHLNLASKKGMQKFVKRAEMTIDKHCSFGANAPSSMVAQPYKNLFDQLAKKLDFGDVQILSLQLKK